MILKTLASNMIDTTKMMINKAQQLTTRIHKLAQTNNKFTIDDYWNMDLYKVLDKGFPDYIGYRNHINYT